MYIPHILSRIVSTMVSTTLRVYISDFEGTPQSKKIKKSISTANRSMFSHDNLECNNLNNALLKLDLNPISIPHFTSMPLNPTRMTSLHWSAEFLQIFPQPHLFARLASLCPAPGCFTGWCVRCVHGLEIVWVEISWVHKGSNFSDFNWRLFTWSKPGNQSLRAAAS